MADKMPDLSNYIPRIADAQVAQYLQIFGAVEITGTKWSGKTWTACKHGRSISYVDRAVNLAQSDPDTMLVGEKPHVIDEWQMAPQVWNQVRHSVDQTRNIRGAFILTGSSSPVITDKNESRVLHSGAGRIGRIRMYPMSLAESGGSSSEVSLSGLFKGEFKSVEAPKDASSLAEYAVRGGWPEACDLQPAQAQIIANQYLNLLFGQDVSKYGKNGETMRRVANSIARNLGQATTYGTILRDMYGEGEHLISSNTLASYLEFMEDIYLIEKIPGWVPPYRSPKRLAIKPKRYFADPSLATALLGMGVDALLEDWQTFGLVFENLCIRDLSVYAQALEGIGNVPVRYYRDDSGLEADAIVELSNGKWAAFEFKLNGAKTDSAIANLKRLHRKVTENPKAQTRPPEFMAVLTGIGEYAYKAEEGIYVIPIRALGN